VASLVLPASVVPLASADDPDILAILAVVSVAIQASQEKMLDNLLLVIMYAKES
jgi:hypothetical protein